MKTMWIKLRPHLLSWHMLPCLLMIALAIGVVIATGRPGALIGALGCMLMMVVMMAMMGGMGDHAHGAPSENSRR